MAEKTRKIKNIAVVIVLTLCNVALILGAILYTMLYSQNVKKQQSENMLTSFENNVETMKQISELYLDSELSRAESWKSYIQEQHMTMDEAIAYISAIDDNSVGEAHFVDMDTFEAWSTYYIDGSNAISYYQKYASSNDEHERANIEIMRKIFAGEKAILSRYKPAGSQRVVIAVGTPVALKNSVSSDNKTYLLLCLISIERMKQLWLFPTNFPSGQIGLIATNADYVIPSNVMRSNTFIDYVRYYNFADDYFGADNLLAQLKTQNSGLLVLNDYKGQACYWYYSRLESYSDIDILGYVPVAELSSDVENLSIVYGVTGLLLLLVLIDGLYILSINQKLRATAQAADKANRSKTQFLSTMSHDIRTPLNAVLGMTELAQNKIDDKEYVRECLRKITVSGNHLLTLINDVLEISRVESGKINISPMPFDVKMLISGLESITRSQATGRGLRFEIRIGDLPCPVLVGDKLRLTQIYLNLLNNAVKYTPAGGSVFMEMHEEPLAEEGKLSLVFVVKDTGIGMSPEFQKTMYESFARVSDGRIDKIQGTGLGLSIVKHLVDLMDGVIECQSEIGKGTTFTVCIPLAAAKESPETVLAETSPDNSNKDLAGLRILVAEDNELNWEIISAMLEEYGIVCDRAENGRECVDKLIAEIPGTYDMVFMDIQMPVMSGLQATRELRSCERMDLQQLPIVAMTADAFAEDVQNCIDAGMNAHVAKPIEIDKVLSAIRILLSRTSGYSNKKK